MLRPHRIGYLILAATACLTSLRISLAEAQVITLARNGEQAAGQPAGVKYWDIAEPAISRDGVVAFTAGVGVNSDPTSFLTEVGYIGTPQSLQIFSSEGDSVPTAGPGTVMLRPQILAMGNGGFGAGISRMSGPLTESGFPFGMTAGGSGSFVALAAAGIVAPDSGGATFTGRMAGPTMNRSGQIGFMADLTGPPEGIFLVTSGTVSKIAISGDTAPTLGIPYFQFIYPPVVGDGGHVGFIARTGVSGNLGPTSLFSGLPGSVQLVAAQDSPAAGGGAGELFGTFGTRVPAMNDQGKVTFRGKIATVAGPISSTSDTAIWTNLPGTMTMLAREGQQAPGLPAGVTYGDFDFSDPVMTNSGKVAFAAPLTGGAAPAAIFAGAPGSLSPVLLAGDPIPGIPSNVTTLSFDRLNMNEAGQMIFQANLGGTGINSFNRIAIVGYDPVAGVQLVARGETPMPGYADLPLEAHLLGSFSGEVPMTLSDSGMVGFWARFTDGERALVTTIPEPGSLGGISVTLAALLRRSRRLPSPLRPGGR